MACDHCHGYFGIALCSLVLDMGPSCDLTLLLRLIDLEVLAMPYCPSAILMQSTSFFVCSSLCAEVLRTNCGVNNRTLEIYLFQNKTNLKVTKC